MTKFQMETNLRYRISPLKLNTNSIGPPENIKLNMSNSNFVEQTIPTQRRREQEIENNYSGDELKNFKVTIEDLVSPNHSASLLEADRNLRETESIDHCKAAPSDAVDGGSCRGTDGQSVQWMTQLDCGRSKQSMQWLSSTEDKQSLQRPRCTEGKETTQWPRCTEGKESTQWPRQTNCIEGKQSMRWLKDVASRGSNKSFILLLFLISCGFVSLVSIHFKRLEFETYEVVVVMRNAAKPENERKDIMDMGDEKASLDGMSDDKITETEATTDRMIDALNEKKVDLVRRGAVTGRVNDFLLRFNPTK